MQGIAKTPELEIERRRKISEALKERMLSEEHRRKLSISLLGNKRNLGYKHTKEAKRKISKALKGKPKSEEHKRKTGEALKGCIPWNKGLKFSEEHKRKLKKARAKQILPQKDTRIEVKIQSFLRKLGIEFFMHQYMNIEHAYQCDILIPSLNMVIECDGNYWHKYPTRRDIDNIRTKELIEKEFRVLRLWENEIKQMDINQFEKRLNRGNKNEGKIEIA